MPARIGIALPREYKGRQIKQRTPFVMSGDLVVPTGGAGRLFADGTFYYAQDLPFEVTRMIPTFVTLDAQSVVQANPVLPLLNQVQIQLQLIGAARAMTLVATRLSVLLQNDELEWDFDAPLYLERGTGFQVAVTNQITGANAAGGIRMEIGFLGSLLDIG
jgi:hypothetical protein